jgi:hypothetical protein
MEDRDATMKKSVYLETTIISYLTARKPKDLIQAARQEVTKQWWEKRRHDFELFVSQVVAREANAGDPDAAARRPEVIGTIRMLDITEETVRLAATLIDRAALPAKATDDAMHVALSAVHGIDFLLTWNCTHLANAELKGTIENVVSNAGFRAPVICTPDELLGE